MIVVCPLQSARIHPRFDGWLPVSVGSANLHFTAHSAPLLLVAFEGINTFFPDVADYVRILMANS